MVTILSGLVLVAYVAWFGWSQLFESPLDRVSSPELALALVVGSAMDQREAVERTPAWERRLYQLTLTDSSSDLPQAISWYEELAEYSSDAGVQLHLAILEAEAGEIESVRGRVAEWEGEEEPYPTYARWVAAGYLEAGSSAAAVPLREDKLAAALDHEWFYDRLVARLARRSGDGGLLAATGEALRARADRLLRRIRGLAAADLALLFIGSVALLELIRRRRHGPAALSVAAAPIPPAWGTRAGTVVLIRGGAITVLLTMGIPALGRALDLDARLLGLVISPLNALVLFLLAHRYLLRPAGLGIGQGLGLSPSRAGRMPFVLWVCVLVAAGVLADWALGLGADLLGLSGHWTEWFDEDLALGTPPEMAANLVDSVVLAPVFEEIAFRGLLFGTLRGRFGVGASAVLSAGIFLAGHDYGLLGFASVFVSGVLWAWAYEKTGSLLPGLVAHGANNLLVSLEVIALLRY
jgi:hypothetical protein